MVFLITTCQPQYVQYICVAGCTWFIEVMAEAISHKAGIFFCFSAGSWLSHESGPSGSFTAGSLSGAVGPPPHATRWCLLCVPFFTGTPEKWSVGSDGWSQKQPETRSSLMASIDLIHLLLLEPFHTHSAWESAAKRRYFWQCFTVVLASLSGH